ncbi:phage tail tape measure protein [Sporosarcina beigongshangi]|uniref:phage tail tape measure protein n=1 Tax=Sporosarcina beigongshangi TaxID=2782538 RepID=UPI00193AC7CC|nr:phage tail tape measure protein [Sporosarcina beigongshangi]
MIARLGADISGFTSQMQIVQQQMSGVGDSFRNLGQQISNLDGSGLQKIGGSITDVGKKMSLVSLPLAAFGGYAAKASVDFESAFAGVKKTIDGTDEDFKMLEDGIRGMAKVLPTSAAEIAGVAEAAGQLGIKTENVLSFTQTMVDLGEATNMTAETASTSFAQFANVVGMPQENFDRLGSSVVALGNNMATTEADIVGMGMRLSGVGAQIGLTESDIMALSATMSSVGISAEAGGSAMTQVLKKIGNAVADGGKGLDKFAAASGLSSSEFASAWESDPITALDSFVKGLSESGIEGENLNAILGDLGIKGINETDTLLRLAGASDLLSEAVGISSDAWEENSALSDEAAQRYATSESKLAMLKNTLTDMAITIGDIIVPVILKMVKVIKPWIEKFSQLSEKTQTIIVVIGAIVAALGPALVIFGSVVSAVGSIVSAFGAMSGVITAVKAGFVLLTGPVGLVVAAIAALVAIGVLVYKNWDEISAFLVTCWENIKEVAVEVWNGLTEFFSNVWEGITVAWSSAWESISSFLEGLWNGIIAIGTAIFDAYKLYFTTLFDAYKTIFTTAWEAIKKVLEVVWNGIVAIGKAIWDGYKKYFTAVLDVYKTIFTTVWNAIKKVLETVWNAIKKVAITVFDALSKFFTTVLDGIKSAFTTIWNAIKTFITNTFNSIKMTATTIWNVIKTTITTIVGGMKTNITNTFNSIKTTASSIFEAVKNSIIKPVDAAKTAVGKAIDAIKGFFSGLSLKFPKIEMPKLPKFTMTGKFSLSPPSVPKIGLNWYETGGIFTGASVVGIGENGDEAVLPLSNKSKMRPFAEAVASMMPRNRGNGSSNDSGGDITINFNVANMNGTKQEADSFTKTIMDNLKRKRGIR